jgi:hypothetical protein
MVPTPGFAACDDMGAAFAGVFWGVLVTAWLGLGTFMAAGGGEVVWKRLKNECCGAKETYGAELESIFLLRIGSDILADRRCRYVSGGLLRAVVLVVNALVKCSAS